QVEEALRALEEKQAALETRERELNISSRLDTIGRTLEGSIVGEGTVDAGSDALEITSSGDIARDGGSGALVNALGEGAEWVEYWDESAGASYYFNTVTQEASWTNPNDQEEGAESTKGQSVNAGDSQSAWDPASLSQPEDGRAKWTECLDESSGLPYWYNVIT
ncbi:unnamed protein product, partial [Choristocarpus tenellus]